MIIQRFEIQKEIGTHGDITSLLRAYIEIGDSRISLASLSANEREVNYCYHIEDATLYHQVEMRQNPLGYLEFHARTDEQMRDARSIFEEMTGVQLSSLAKKENTQIQEEPTGLVATLKDPFED